MGFKADQTEIETMKDDGRYDKERCGKKNVNRKSCEGLVFLRDSIAQNYLVGVCTKCGNKKLKVKDESKAVH